LDMWARN